MDIGEPERASHLDTGPALFFGPKPHEVDIEYRLERMLELLNRLAQQRMEQDAVVTLALNALARQPHVDREQWFADFMAAAEAHYRTPHPEVVSPAIKTLGWFLKNPLPQ